MSIIPGIETAAPERTETSSGSSRRRSACPVVSSSRAHVLVDLLARARPAARRAAMYARQASVVIVNPAGTGTPSRVISARPIPLPPSSSRPPAAVLVEVVDVRVRHVERESTGLRAARAELGRPTRARAGRTRTA